MVGLFLLPITVCLQRQNVLFFKLFASLYNQLRSSCVPLTNGPHVLLRMVDEAGDMAPGMKAFILR